MNKTLEQYRYATALVTGASSGIGVQYAQYLASHQINLVLVARSQNKLEALAQQLRQQYQITVSVISQDLSKHGAAQHLYNEIGNRQLSIDILINNAGFGKWAPFLSVPLASYEEMMQLNMGTLTALCHLLLPSMLKQQKGIVINIASTGAFQPLPYIAVYGATKAYVLSFTEAIAKEYEGTGVQCLAVSPGNTETQFAAVAGANTKGMAASSAEEVVVGSFKALDHNKMSVTIGVSNVITTLLPRILPRQTILSIVKNMIGKRIQ